VTVTASIERLPAKVVTGPLIVAVPRARVVAGPLKVTVGALVYPEPPLVTDTDTTVAVRDADSVDVPTAAVPPAGAGNTGVGAVL
jgi:hypothetical protein